MTDKKREIDDRDWGDVVVDTSSSAGKFHEFSLEDQQHILGSPERAYELHGMEAVARVFPDQIKEFVEKLKIRQEKDKKREAGFIPLSFDMTLLVSSSEKERWEETFCLPLETAINNICEKGWAKYEGVKEIPGKETIVKEIRERRKWFFWKVVETTETVEKEPSQFITTNETVQRHDFILSHQDDNKFKNKNMDVTTEHVEDPVSKLIEIIKEGKKRNRIPVINFDTEKFDGLFQFAWNESQNIWFSTREDGFVSQKEKKKYKKMIMSWYWSNGSYGDNSSGQ